MKPKKLLTLTLIAFMLAMAMPLINVTPILGDGWIANPATGHCYRLTDAMFWEDAEAQANAWGGHLVTINDSAEESWLQGQFGTSEIFWIGFNDLAEEGTWVWASGATSTYTNWCSGEPNDRDRYGHSEDFAVINYTCKDGGKAWNDFPIRLDVIQRGIVEYAGCVGGVMNPTNGHYYKVIGPTSWMDAEAQAIEQGGHLVTINDREEELWLQAQFGTSYRFWIGFNDKENEGNWVWSSGEPVTYTNWCLDEPNDCCTIEEEGEENAAVMNADVCEDGWNDLIDWHHHWAIMERPKQPTVDANGPYQVDEGDSVLFKASGSDPDLVQPEGIISYWKLDDGEGMTACDSANGNHGSLINEPAWTTGQVGGALSFDGIDDYLNVGGNVNPGIQGTFELWFMADCVTPDSQILLSKYTSDMTPPNPPGGAWRERCYFVGLQANQLWVVVSPVTGTSGGGEAIQLTSTQVFDPGIWYHAAVTVTSEDITLYVNGAPDASSGVGLPQIAGSSLPTIIGCNNYPLHPTHARPYEGIIDEIAIYNRALTPEEIEHHYQNGLNGMGYESPDPLTYSWDLDNDGIFETPGQSVAFSAAELDGPSSHTVAVQVTDSVGLTATDEATVDVFNVAPTITSLTLPVGPVDISVGVDLMAEFSDPCSDDTHSAEIDWGHDPEDIFPNMDSPILLNHTYPEPGVYAVTLTVTDDDGDSSQSVFEYVVIYDTGGGFVTGGGWIDSPEGAYRADPTLTGKANFGFVSKYKKKSTIPIGNTEFQLKAGDFNFHSDSYEWLIVNQNGKNAQFKGDGTINGTGEYKFMIWAGGGDPDTFRIKIWEDENNGEMVVYDNGTKQSIGGGSIAIHTKKN